MPQQDAHRLVVPPVPSPRQRDESVIRM